MTTVASLPRSVRARARVAQRYLDDAHTSPEVRAEYVRLVGAWQRTWGPWCRRCFRVLTDPESIERGYGPECAGKVDL